MVLNVTLNCHVCIFGYNYFSRVFNNLFCVFVLQPLNQFCEEIKAEIENLLTNPFLSFDCSEDKIVETKDCDDESIHENVNGENTMSQRRRSYPRGNESVIEIIGGNRYDGNYGDGDGTGGLLQSWC